MDNFELEVKFKIKVYEERGTKLKVQIMKKIQRRRAGEIRHQWQLL